MQTKLVLACASLLLPVTGSAVQTTYTYTGLPYTIVQNADEIPGEYDTSMSVSGFLTLSEAMPASSSVRLDDSPSILSFDFFDGRLHYTNTDQTTGTNFFFTTDASGVPQSWSVHIGRRSGLPSGAVNADTHIEATGDSAHIHTSPSGIFDAAGTGLWNIGTWTVTPVPEPSEYALLLAGIALVGFAAHRRNRLQH